MVVYSFNLSTWEAEAGRALGFEANSVYIVGSRPSKQTRNHNPPPHKHTLDLVSELVVWGILLCGP